MASISLWCKRQQIWRDHFGIAAQRDQRNNLMRRAHPRISNNTIESIRRIKRSRNSPIGNKFAGICMFYANNNQIGASLTGAYQIYLGNDRSGFTCPSLIITDRPGEPNRVGGGVPRVWATGCKGVMMSILPIICISLVLPTTMEPGIGSGRHSVRS